MMTTPDVVLNTKDWHADDLHSVHSPDPDAALLPAAQSSHDADPNTLLYLPSTQPAHGPPSGPVKPTVHQHAVTMVLPNGE